VWKMLIFVPVYCNKRARGLLPLRVDFPINDQPFPVISPLTINLSRSFFTYIDQPFAVIFPYDQPFLRSFPCNDQLIPVVSSLPINLFPVIFSVTNPLISPLTINLFRSFIPFTVMPPHIRAVTCVGSVERVLHALISVLSLAIRALVRRVPR